MALRDVLRHRARRVRDDVRGAVVEGERIEDRELSADFRCVVFPSGTREAGRSGRRTEQPQLLFEGRDVTGAELVILAEDAVQLLEAPGLEASHLGEYQVDGAPQWLGKPGRAPRVIQVNLKRVRD